MQFPERVECFYIGACTFKLILRGGHVKFENREEQEQFIKIATMLKYYKHKGVPVPAEVRDEIERNRDKSEVFHVLNDILNE